MVVSKMLFIKLFLIIVVVNVVGCSNVNDYCENPAPLTGNKDNIDSGFIIKLNDNIDLSSEISRLTQKYEFEVTQANESENIFIAPINYNTMEQIRCEESVQSIFIIDSSIQPPTSPPALEPDPAPPPPPPVNNGGPGGGGGM